MTTAFNVNSQTVEEATVSVDMNGEYLFKFEDGSFFKLPSYLTEEQVTEELAKYELANTGQVKAEE